MVTGEKSKTGARIAVGVLSVFSLIWVAPILFTILQSFRPFADVVSKGVMSWPNHLTFENYTHAFVQSRMWLFFLNSCEVAVPAVVITLFLAS
ncbi:MAG: carbohydrate ABC transporter permease, partial [Actinomycetes bacterium]